MNLDFQSRVVTKSTPAHVINIEIKDNHEDATLGAFLICELCQMVGGKCKICIAIYKIIVDSCENQVT